MEGQRPGNRRGYAGWFLGAGPGASCSCVTGLGFRTHSLVSGLGDFGAIKAFAGIRRKVILTQQAEVAAVLTSYFHVRNGGTKANLGCRLPQGGITKKEQFLKRVERPRVGSVLAPIWLALRKDG